MRNFTKNLIAYYLTLYILTAYLNPAVTISQGFLGFTKVVIAFTLIFPLIRPLLKLILLPINLLTLGLFSFLIDFVLIYLLGIIIPNFHIQNMLFPNINLFNIHIVAFTLNRFWSIVAVSLQISLLQKIIRWFLK